MLGEGDFAMPEVFWAEAIRGVVLDARELGGKRVGSVLVCPGAVLESPAGLLGLLAWWSPNGFLVWWSLGGLSSSWSSRSQCSSWVVSCPLVVLVVSWRSPVFSWCLLVLSLRRDGLLAAARMLEKHTWQLVATCVSQAERTTGRRSRLPGPHGRFRAWSFTVWGSPPAQRGAQTRNNAHDN